MQHYVDCVLVFSDEQRNINDFLCCLHSYRLQWQQHVRGSDLSGNHLHLHPWCWGLHEGSAAVFTCTGSFSLGEVRVVFILLVWRLFPADLLLGSHNSHVKILCRNCHASADGESLCFFRLAEAKSSVVKALADDFDTPRAVNAAMNLVYHGNRQLQPVSTVISYCTSDSPGII